MSAENWIDILNRAIQMNADWEVDDDSGQKFIYDAEVLNDIVTLVENGATSDEIVHQYGEYVGSDFERYIEVLEQAMEQTDEEELGVPEEQDASLVEDSVGTGKLEPLEEGDEVEEAAAEAPNRPNKTTIKSKKGLVVGSAVAGLVVLLCTGGVVFYTAFTQSSTPVAQNRSVTTVLKAAPKTPVEEAAPAQSEGTSDRNTNAAATQSQLRTTQNQGFTVAQMGPAQDAQDPEQSHSQTESVTKAPPVQQLARSTKPAPGNTIDDSHIEEMRDEINAQIEKIEESMTAKIGDRLGDLRETLGRMEAQLKRIDELEKKIAQEQSDENVASEIVNQKVKGLTRLGEFSILANAGVNNRVVALSPTNKVITLEEGERNILVAGSNLRVEEIVGNGDAVIFSNGWFIDHVRAPESLREQRLNAEAESSGNPATDASDDPQVPRTAAVSKSLNPALVAASTRNKTTSDPRFPTIQRAPQGWEATALIPPRRAVIITPEGNSITITPGFEIAGLGKVHSVKQDRVLAGQFFIPLSNL